MAPCEGYPSKSVSACVSTAKLNYSNKHKHLNLTAAYTDKHTLKQYLEQIVNCEPVYNLDGCVSHRHRYKSNPYYDRLDITYNVGDVC